MVREHIVEMMADSIMGYGNLIKWMGFILYSLSNAKGRRVLMK